MSVFPVPKSPVGPLQEQVRQQYAYLFQLAGLLNASMSQLEASGGAEGGTVAAAGPADRAEAAAREKQTAQLKSLIVKTAETVHQEMERLEVRLRGSFVAASQFGTYLQELNSQLAADPEGVSQYYKFLAQLQNDAEQTALALEQYRTEVEGYIRQGIVRYEGTTPVIGIAIGQDIKTTATGVETERGVFDEIDTRSNMSVWTTERLSFYIGGQEAAYFSNGALTVAVINTDRVRGGGTWDVSFLGGVKCKWIGG